MKKDNEDIKEIYKENILKTLDNIKDNIDYILEDIHNNAIQNINIIIDVEPGEVVYWKLDKKYLTHENIKEGKGIYYYKKK